MIDKVTPPPAQIVETVKRFAKQWQAVIDLAEAVDSVGAFQRLADEAVVRNSAEQEKADAIAKAIGELGSGLEQARKDHQAGLAKLSDEMIQVRGQAKAILADAKSKADAILAVATGKAALAEDAAKTRQAELDQAVADRTAQLATLEGQVADRANVLAEINKQLEAAKAGIHQLLGA